MHHQRVGLNTSAGTENLHPVGPDIINALTMNLDQSMGAGQII
jgi:hypothetical protein